MGELGWELHHSIDQMSEIYDLIIKEGEQESIIDFGTRAMNSMRIEKGYRGWGTELTPEISVVEAGLDKFFNLEKKNEFKGSEAVTKLLKNGIETKLYILRLRQKMLMHMEMNLCTLIIRKWDLLLRELMVLELKKV